MAIFNPLFIVGFARRILLRIKSSNSPERGFPAIPGSPQVSFTNDGRSGRVLYKSAAGSFDMYYEFGGGDAVAVISAPSPQRWVSETGFPLDQRESILNFIGQETVRKQAPGGSFTIESYGLVIWESGKR